MTDMDGPRCLEPNGDGWLCNLAPNHIGENHFATNPEDPARHVRFGEVITDNAGSEPQNS